MAVLICSLGAPHLVRAGFDTVRETGPSSNRVEIFFVGDGYTAADHAAGTYAAHVQNYTNYLFSNFLLTDPYYRYRNYFNVYRVNVISNESGADVPQNEIYRDTALDATYRADGVTDRLLVVNDSKAEDALSAALAGSGKTADVRYAVVNSGIYGGSGGYYATFAGGNVAAHEIALHESAHSFNGLADEYVDYFAPFPESEPNFVNVTTDPTGAKWSHWLGYSDPSGGIGVVQGAFYYSQGVYRPSLNSKMRSLGTPFDAVAREKIILDIYGLVDPLDSYDTNAAPLYDPGSIAVTPIDDQIISTQWFIDGAPQSAFNDQNVLTFAGLGLAAGSHSIQVRAYDPTGFDFNNGWVRRNTADLEQYVRWDIMITVPEPGSLLLALIGLAVVAFCPRKASIKRLRQGGFAFAWERKQ